MSEVYSILTGGKVPATTPKASTVVTPMYPKRITPGIHRDAPSALKRDLEEVKAGVAYLKKPPEEQARLAAQPAIEQAKREKAAIAQAAAAERARLEAAHRAETEARARERELERAEVRGQIEAQDLAYGRLRSEHETLRTTATQAAETHARELAARDQALSEMTAAAAAREAAHQAALEQALRATPKRPEKVDFEYRWTPNRLLKAVVLKADGYNDVVVNILRGADDRMHRLKIGDDR